jgi:hypothetical protein
MLLLRKLEASIIVGKGGSIGISATPSTKLECRRELGTARRPNDLRFFLVSGHSLNLLLLLLLSKRGKTRSGKGALSVPLLELRRLLLLRLILVAALVDFAFLGYVFTHGMKVG